MTIETHTPDRKALARQISELLHVDVVYASVPSCAYNVGPVMIDRGGSIHTNDSQALETLKPFLIEQGWLAPEAEALTVDSGAAPEQMEISVPAEGMTVTSLLNLVHMLYSKQYLFNRMTESGSLFISKNLIDSLKEHTPEDLAAFQQRLSDSIAHGELDGFSYSDGNVTLRYPFHAEQPMRWTTYGLLTDKIIKTAQSATRITAQVQEPENEKYFARSWLLRLGMGGADFKEERRILLGGLKGHMAFSDDAAAQKHMTRYAEKRRNAMKEAAPE